MGPPAPRTGCWVHCYREGSDVPYFIVRKTAESGSVSLSYRITEAADDAERLLVGFGADPAEARAGVREALERGSAHVRLRESSSG